MGYNVRIEKSAEKTLRKMDRFQARVIVDWIEKNLVNCSDPFQQGKGLTADKSGFWRYRVGAYRIITDISQEDITILIVKIGHRKEIYK